MEESRKRLTRICANAKSAFTRMEKFVDNYMADQKSEQLEIRLKLINENWEKYTQAQDELEELAYDSYNQQQREEMEERYCHLTGFIQSKLKELEVTAAPESNVNVEPAVKVKLPQLSIPKFSGQLQDWVTFKDTFLSLVGSNTTIPNIQKFHYLLAAINGEARKVIQHIPASEQGFRVAWEILVDRYENERLIINTHIDNIMKLPSLVTENTTQLRQIVDTTKCNLEALKAMNLHTDTWDLMIIYILVQKLDNKTKREWELQIASKELPTLLQLYNFLEHRCNALESVAHRPKTTDTRQNNDRKPSHSYLSIKSNCEVCKETHSTSQCNTFRQLSNEEKYKIVKNNKLCINCLSNKHMIKDCHSHGCNICGRWHHTLLHRNNETSQDHVNRRPEQLQQQRNVQATYHSFKELPITCVLLATAQVKIKDCNGKARICRALLDCGSQSNFITESTVRRLGLVQTRNRVPITGINNATSVTNYKVELEMSSMTTEYTSIMNCLVLPRITSNMPMNDIDISTWEFPEDVVLADKEFHKSGPIDILLGAETFFEILTPGRHECKGLPVLQNTKLGYILSGKIHNDYVKRYKKHCHALFVQTDSLNHLMERFWSIEEMNTPILTKEEKACEEHFQLCTRRLETGRYEVRLPLKDSCDKLGESYDNARTKFLALEQRLLKQPQFKQEYSAFLDEYVQMGHMTPVSEDEEKKKVPHFYMPHHGIIKEASSTTRLRVVFNGSEKSSSGISLNDLLMTGPKIQDDLFDIVQRFRLHRIVMSADIAKMYRQIWVHPDDRGLQRILWRNRPTQPITTYELNTVTYGTTSAPFLATRCLQQLIDDEAVHHPEAAKLAKEGFYVDDLLTGADELETAISMQQELIYMLRKGGFTLRKWSSNHPALLERLAHEDVEQNVLVNFGNERVIKALGLLWNPTTDKLMFCVQFKQDTEFTKRSVLRIIASIYDPLGLLSPITIQCKMFLQQLWLLKVNWDEPLPTEFREQWYRLQYNLPSIQSIQIDRLAIAKHKLKEIELHGFSDASEGAYGACLYFRSIDIMGNITTQLLCAKSRVAPLKRLSLPRLELCAAMLLADLYLTSSRALKISVTKVRLWTDSMVVLAWLRSPATRWKTFVANRVNHIQESTNVDAWNHVKSKENPADLVSRGMDANLLRDSRLWWHGPDWLQQEDSTWPKCEETVETCNEEKPLRVISLLTQPSDEEMFTKFSTWTKLQRVSAYCLRFIYNCCHKNSRYQGPLSPSELREATLLCVKHAQSDNFKREKTDLMERGRLSVKSSLLSLNPFLDGRQCLRVGGRLQNSELSFDQQHPLILPKGHHITTLIIKDMHYKNAHARGQLLLSLLRQQYWIPDGRNVVKKVLHNCLTCFRLNSTTASQLMGQLPQERVTPTRAFTNSGVDYAGPFHIKQGGHRSKTTVKSYIALFICLSTKAIHLELVPDLSTEAYIAALRRFIARRGICTNLYSDNGTNFVGAEKEIKKIIRETKFVESISNYANYHGIKFHFVPPGSPHMGGLWEAGVKSMKYHLRRVVGKATLTFVEFYTLLCQVEAILNSRPLCSLSNNPENLQVLTPGHFLIGTSLLSLPDPNLLDVPSNRLSKWLCVQQMTQHLWRHWSHDYLHQLQQRNKWKTTQPNVKIGDLVLVKEDNLPPLVWKKAVISDIHPGKDGLTRVVTLRTATGMFKRPITKICLLPKVE